MLPLFRISAMTALLATLLATSGQSAEYAVAPGDDYRALLSRLEPGDTLVFEPGVHDGATMLRLQGAEGRPITLRGRLDDEGRRPTVQFTGRGQNLWRLTGGHVVIRDLELHCAGGYALRVDRADYVRIENCHFRDNGGGDVSANTANVHGLHIMGCRFTGSRRTPVYIGLHDGGLQVTDFRFEGNVIDGRQIGAEVGYGIQLKLNVTGSVIRGNWIEHTRGPGIMVYGATDEDPALGNLVEGNVVVATRHSGGILVGGGPARVRGNLVLANPQGGIRVYDYGGRDMLRHIEVAENTVAGNSGYDLSLSGRLRDVTVSGNVALTRSGSAGIRGAPDGQTDNRVTAAPAELVVALDALTAARLDPDALAEAVGRLPGTTLDAAALQQWLDQIPVP